jgi:predicted esterase YcpF (UPF0227 family)
MSSSTHRPIAASNSVILAFVPSDAVEILSESKQIVEEGGSHGFDAVERYFDEIDAFLSR